MYIKLAKMNKFLKIFNEIKKQIRYILNDTSIIYSDKYFMCMNEILTVLNNTLSKIQDIYYKYILFPNLQKL
jgi:hypothetical protein